MTETKPPLGLKPRHIHDETRVSEILDAVRRYYFAGKLVPREWLVELRELTARPHTPEAPLFQGPTSCRSYSDGIHRVSVVSSKNGVVQRHCECGEELPV